MTETLIETDRRVTAFAELLGKLETRDAPAIRAFRERAMENFVRLGFPSTKSEEWRYTNVQPVARTDFRLPDGRREAVSRATIAPVLLGDAASAELVFVDGRFDPELSSTSPANGVDVMFLADLFASPSALLDEFLGRAADPSTQPFVALNAALMRDGAVIRIHPGAIVEEPLHVVHVITTDARALPPMVNSRVLVIAEPGSQASIVESSWSAGGGRSFSNGVTEVFARAGAVIDHYRVQRESAQAIHFSALFIHEDRDAAVTTRAMDLGGALVRNEVSVRLDGEGSSCSLDGLSLIDGSRHVDNQTRIDHLQPHTTSQEYYKGILDDTARGVFDGRVVVHPGAQKTNARQTNKNLLLSRDAIVDTKPTLEIYADDVKCNHGSTVGQLDEDSIFYLRSRGISLEESRKILTWAFASEIVQRIRLKTLREQLQNLLLERMPQGTSEGALS
ncbi:MAG: Fe-S cluster assembly protein SufD [Thermoanaerobaculia bacterium]